MTTGNTRIVIIAVAIAALVFGGVAGSLIAGGGTTDDDTVPRTDYEALQSQLQQQTVPVSVVQQAQLAPAPAQAEPTGWDTTESIRGGLHLLAEFDSSGEDAWDVNEHPLVYFTSESHQNPNPDKNGAVEDFAGFHIIDAYSKQVVASALYSYEGDIVRGPHGVGVSPDGQWAYVGWAEEIDGNTVGLVAIVNSRTLKMDKLLMQESYYQGAMRSQSLHHIQAWRDVDGQDRVILQWGFGADGGPHFILDPNDDNRVLRAITYDDIHTMGHPYTTPDPTGEWVYVSIGSPKIRSSHYMEAGVAKLNIETGEIIEITQVGNHPIGITHTQDGRYTYVIDGHRSEVFKIDNETNEVVGETSAGVAGPYGIALNWNETELYTIGKGEGSHNTGGVVGIIDLTTFTPKRLREEVFNQPITLGGSASSIDHGILHPDPEVNELWISNMNGWETIVLNLDTYEVTDYIPTPNGGDTHSGAFVRYNPDGTGELLVDMGGPKAQSVRDTIRAQSEHP